MAEILTARLSEDDLDSISGGLSRTERIRLQDKKLDLQSKLINARRAHNQSQIESIQRQINAINKKLYG